MTDSAFDYGDLVALVPELKNARVLCVGDVMLDRYVTGKTERISPEAPVPVLHVTGESTMLGGAGNVARNLAALGVQVHAVGVIGDDAAGNEIQALFDALPSARADLIKTPDRQSAIKTRFLADTQQLMRADRETVAPLAAKERDGVLKATAQALKECSVLLLSDYGKGLLLDGMAQKLIEAAKAANVTVIVDPKNPDYAAYAGADVITPNRRELSEAGGGAAETDEEVAATAQKLIAAHKLGAVLATRSRDGMTLITARDGATHLQAAARDVFDVSGAGDTVVAALAAGMAAGAALTDAARLANVAAGIVVGKVGTAVAHADEVIAALHHQSISDAEAKILARDHLLERTGVWRRQGLRIGFTNGCFDLLHPGHVSLLKQAKQACDKLIVAVNADDSVTRLKGDGRPVQNEAARATVLASLASVDAVVIFAEDTPRALIEAVRPDVLVKGADYARADVVGADIVEGYGGKILLATLEPGHSTSATIERLNRNSV